MNKNYKSILEDIEKMIIENYYPHEKIGKYIEVIKICEKKGDQKKANEIRDELNLLNRLLGAGAPYKPSDRSIIHSWSLPALAGYPNGN